MTKAQTHDFRDGYGPVPSHIHTKGGGWVADTANVHNSAYIGPDARVSGNARISGDARVYGNARVHGWTSYRYAGRYGTIMIGATSTRDALNEADRSLTQGAATVERLEIWNALTGLYEKVKE